MLRIVGKGNKEAAGAAATASILDELGHTCGAPIATAAGCSPIRRGDAPVNKRVLVGHLRSKLPPLTGLVRRSSRRVTPHTLRHS